MIWEELKESLILTDLDAKSYQDVMQSLGQVLIDEGYCKESYIEALIKREEEFPTGIDINGIGVAIPHTDASHVNHHGVAIAGLKQPVAFIQMGTDDEPVDVRLVFMLAVVNPNEHIGDLQRILEIIQDPKVLEQLQQAKDDQSVIQIIKEKEKTL